MEQIEANINSYPDTVREHISGLLRSVAGSTITRVGLEQWSVELVLIDHSIRIEGNWNYSNSDGQLIDQHVDLEKRSEFNLWKTVGQNVESAIIVDAPFSNLHVRLVSGEEIVAYGNNDDYEDWALDDMVCMRTLNPASPIYPWPNDPTI